MESQLGVGRAGCRPRLGSSEPFTPPLLGPTVRKQDAVWAVRQKEVPPPGSEEELTLGHRGHQQLQGAVPDHPGLRVPHRTHAPQPAPGCFPDLMGDTHDSLMS